VVKSCSNQGEEPEGNRCGGQDFYRHWKSFWGIAFRKEKGKMAKLAQLGALGAIAGSVVAYYLVSSAYGGDRDVIIAEFHAFTKSLGIWAMPVYIATHTLAIAMCFPYAVAFEAGAAFLFGFFRGVVCVFTAKVLGAALAFGIGRSEIFPTLQPLSVHNTMLFAARK
jgi:uncharacterized membrane protein YdjX (TVP38/TMEM64 family)